MFVEQLAVSLCLLCVRLRAEYGRSARGGPSGIKNERALDTPSFAVTRRLLAAARIWIMMRAPLTDHRIPIPPRYVERLRAHFIRMFVDFVEGEESREHEGKWPSPSCPAETMQNIEILNCGGGQVPAIIFPGGPNFHAYTCGDLMRPKPHYRSDDEPDDD